MVKRMRTHNIAAGDAENRYSGRPLEEHDKVTAMKGPTEITVGPVHVTREKETTPCEGCVREVDRHRGSIGVRRRGVDGNIRLCMNQERR